MEYKVGNNANIANLVCLWKPRMLKQFCYNEYHLKKQILLIKLHVVRRTQWCWQKMPTEILRIHLYNHTITSSYFLWFKKIYISMVLVKTDVFLAWEICVQSASIGKLHHCYSIRVFRSFHKNDRSDISANIAQMDWWFNITKLC